MNQDKAGDEEFASPEHSLTPDSPSAGPQPAYCPSFQIVGIGASAGGLDAFTQLLHELPVDTDLGLVLVPHLLPGHSSTLAEILSRATRMPVTQAADRTVVKRSSTTHSSRRAISYSATPRAWAVFGTCSRLWT